MKNPNGYGSVVKMKGNRRKPYVVRKTIGWNEKGYPIYSVIGYCRTREEGMILLAEYNGEPWDVDKAKITFDKLFELWKEKKAMKLGKSNLRNLSSAYNHCGRVHKLKYKDVKSFHMQECIDNCGHGSSTQSAIKNLFRHLDKLALELDIINRCYSELLTSAQAPETSKRPFTDDEVDAVWGISEMPWVDSVLTLLYTGFRVSELLDLRVSDVDLEAWTLKGGTKTAAGKDRVVPIHERILPIIQSRIEDGGEYLFGTDKKKITATTYYKHWDKIMETLNLKYTPHECRHTFRSRLDSAGANKRCIDLLMGHKSRDVGERIYTHKTIDELRETIELLG